MAPAAWWMVLQLTAVATPWKQLAPGLEWTELRAPVTSPVGDSRITVVRVDPRVCSLELASAAQAGGRAGTAEAWARTRGYHVVTNAGMFHANGAPVGHFKTRGASINPVLGRDRALLAFHPRGAALAPARLLDRDCDDVDALRDRYDSMLQGIRMVDCHGRNRWTAQDKRWSAAVLGEDDNGRLLFIHSRSPFTMHTLVQILLKLPIHLQRAMYLEGGPEASLVVSTTGTSIVRVGSYETGFNENDDNHHLWELPNVIGVKCGG